MRITRGRGIKRDNTSAWPKQQAKRMAQTTGHALAHKTWFCHDPVTRLEK